MKLRAEAKEQSMDKLYRVKGVGDYCTLEEAFHTGSMENSDVEEYACINGDETLVCVYSYCTGCEKYNEKGGQCGCSSVLKIHCVDPSLI